MLAHLKIQVKAKNLETNTKVQPLNILNKQCKNKQPVFQILNSVLRRHGMPEKS